MKKRAPTLFTMLSDNVIQQKNIKPTFFQLVIALVLRPSQFSILIRKFVASRQPLFEGIHVPNLPTIEALVVVAKKDFGVLVPCLENLQNGSSNPISKISLITPSSDVQLCKDLVTHSEQINHLNLEILDEETFFDIEFLSDLRSTFRHRYGWVLQQLLCLEHVFNSHANGILVVDADTVLLSPRNWMTKDNIQMLLVSSEYNRPYYAFLNRVCGTKKKPKYTFVTHHMLMQPKLLRRMLSSENLNSPEELGRVAMLFADLNTQSPVSLDFEVYGQLAIKHFSEKVRLAKFSNIGLSTEINEIPYVVERELIDGKYMSVSFHEYTRTLAN